MRMVVIGALVLASLAGCAGSKMKEARSGTPYKTLASDKAPLVVAQCIQFGWQDEAVFGVPNSVAVSSTRSVWVRSSASTAWLEPVAAGIGTQALPEESQRTHW